MISVVEMQSVMASLCLAFAVIQPMVSVEHEIPLAADDWVLEEVAPIGTQLPAGSTGRANRTSIAIDSNDEPHIAFQNVETGEIRYAHKDPSGKWQNETVTGPNIKGSFVDLELDSKDQPVVCYANLSSHGLSCAFREKSGWRYETVDDTPYSGTRLSLVLDEFDRPHLAYVAGPGHVRYSWWIGHEWNTTEVRNFALGCVGSTSLNLDYENNAHIALVSFLPEHGLWLYVQNVSKWDVKAIDPTNRPGEIFSLVLDSHNLPHLVYGDTWRQVPRYAYNDGVLWNFRTVDAENRSLVGSFKLDSHQSPHVAYLGYDSWDLRYAYLDNGIWKKEIVDSEGLVGFRPSLAIDSKDIPSISYLDLTDWVLMYATKKKGIQAEIDIDPDTLNLNGRGKWITCYIELPAGYDPRDIDPNTILLNDFLKPELNPKYGFVVSESSYIVDHDEDGLPERMVKFDRSEVQKLLSPGDSVSITIVGQLLDGTDFEGSDEIRVIDPHQASTSARQ
ncbi:MAG: hypothetical protein JSV43_04905 [Methanobacteriota archaeon]|nr:MAG: hypothetical protein JSV43_04905 [Euryarchaeota archaeon]